MPVNPPLPPHLVDKDGKKICSMCSEVIEPHAGSLSKGFRLHVQDKHAPKVQQNSAKKKWAN